MSQIEQNPQSVTPLADRFKALVKETNTVVDEATATLEEYYKLGFGRLASHHIESRIQKFDQIVFKLHIHTWAMGLVYKELAFETESLKLRDMNADDVLFVVESCQMSVVEDLHSVFNQMETNLATLSQASQSLSRDVEDEWISYFRIVDETTEAVAQSLVALDEQKSRLHEQLESMSTEDVRRRVWDRSNREATVLSIDGGGVKSYSSLLIIKALMDHVLSEIKDTWMKKGSLHEEADEVRPRDIFNYIFGSSSGGLIAIMLGRLEMSVDQSLESFRNYADEIFAHPQPLSKVFGRHLTHKYSDERLIQATRALIKKFDPSPDHLKWGRTLFDAPGSKCKTGVIAWRLHGEGGNRHIFRSYIGSPFSNQDPTPKPGASCHIWDVARATSAAPTYFSTVNIDDGFFIGGGVGTNNPARQALNELYGDWKDTSLKPLIISIGSGLTPRKPLPGSSSSASSTIGKTIQPVEKKASDTEDVHEDMKRISDAQGFDYFRFNVDSGLEDLKLDSWSVTKIYGVRVFETIETITAQTGRYIERQEVAEELRRCAHILVQKYIRACIREE